MIKISAYNSKETYDDLVNRLIELDPHSDEAREIRRELELKKRITPSLEMRGILNMAGDLMRPSGIRADEYPHTGRREPPTKRDEQ